MATPCRLLLNPQSDWMVFSTPEMTTVSKPKRNPASAEVTDQMKIRAFMSGNQRTGQTMSMGSQDRLDYSSTATALTSLWEDRAEQAAAVARSKLTGLPPPD